MPRRFAAGNHRLPQVRPVDPPRRRRYAPDAEFPGLVLSDGLSLVECRVHAGATLSLTVSVPADDARVQAMIAAPSVQSILRRSPCFFTEMELSECLHECIGLSDRPHLAGECARLVDSALTCLEVAPAGLSEVAQGYQDFKASGMEAAMFGRQAPPRAPPASRSRSCFPRRTPSIRPRSSQGSSTTTGPDTSRSPRGRKETRPSADALYGNGRIDSDPVRAFGQPAEERPGRGPAGG